MPRNARGKRYILFLDEPHHIAEGMSWETAIQPLVDAAVLTVFASGTLYRGDEKRISFLPYDASGKVVNTEPAGVRWIQYSRRDAVREQAIVPVQFRTIDGESSWEELDGEEQTASLSAESRHAGKALFTALRTDYAYDLLQACIEDWKKELKRFPEARLLVVAPNIETAKKYQVWLIRYGVHSRIATSEDSLLARSAIRDYRKGLFPALVTVAMAYEGLSIRQITHIACLTHIRSVPWLEQCFARANRLYPGKQHGRVYGPKDIRFMKAIEAIEEEQVLPAAEETPEDGEGESREGKGEKRPWINPLHSRAHLTDEIIQSLQIPESKKEAVLLQQIRYLRRHVIQGKHAGSIQTAQRLFSKRMRRIVDKPLKQMRVSELTDVWMGLRDIYEV